MKKNELRTKLIEKLSQTDKPLQLNEISKSFQYKADSSEYFVLKEALNELCEEKIVQKSSRRRYSLASFDNVSTIEGTIRIDGDRGVVYCSLKYPILGRGKKVDFQYKTMKVVIKRKNLQTALDGDTVLIRLYAEKKGKKPRGEVIEIVSRKERTITGTLEFDGNYYFLIPDDESYYIDFLIPDKGLKGAGHGDKVSAKFINWDDPLKSPIAEITAILGKAGKPDVGYRAVMAEFDLPEGFNSKVLQEANTIFAGFKIAGTEIPTNRLDLRKETIVTIDPPDAKDFDDALSLKILDNGNFILGVHIADVSYYVKQNSEMDREAYNRGTSVYLVDRVVPMLPEIISNEICSLVPRKNRLTFSVFMEINKFGTVKSYEIKESIIKSTKRLSYDEVLKLIEKANNGYTPKNEVEKLLLELHKLAQLLRKKRFEKGGVDFETVEVKFELDENKNPVNAIVRESNAATSLVEECMLMANKTIAEHIHKISKNFGMKKDLPFLYRVHDVPDQEKMTSTFRFLKLLTKEKPPNNFNSKTLNYYLKQFKDKPQKSIVNQMIVRSMPKAEYVNENIGHFGLGFSKYTHFTSPIRRYPDLIVHRFIKEYNTISSISSDRIRKHEDFLKRAGEHSTSRERVALEAERASVKYAQTFLASTLVGKVMNGTISGVTNFGIFVNLDDIYAEGMIHIRDLADDYYLFDEQNFRLIGRLHKRIFQFGDRITVLIVRTNLEKRKIELKHIEVQKIKSQ